MAVGYFGETLPDRFNVDTGKEFSFSRQEFTAVQNIPSSLSPTEVSLPENTRLSSVKLLGCIPIKTVSVQAVDEVSLIPSGNPFGVKMFTDGAMVVGVTEIETMDGVYSPCKAAGIAQGDVIVSINKKQISRNEDVQLLVETSGGEPLLFKVRRGEEEFETTLTPVLCVIDGRYKSGIWVRDSAAGIGTITYVDPATSAFAGLGHGVCDVDTGEILSVGTGEVCEVDIHGINKGKAGLAGELMGTFSSPVPIGTIVENNATGIYGKLFDSYSDRQAYTLAHKQEVQLGEATILCALGEDMESKELQEYSIEITSLDYNEKNKIKNMVIKVTDKDLLSLTGGIVQGMSGTPILQNGKLVGAVTHVFINNPEKGYGIFAENMYEYSKEITSDNNPT